MEKKFEWYEYLSNSEEITQGDILINFPVLKCDNYKEFINSTSPEDFELNIEVEYIDCIILTQACDIAQEKPDLENIILCRIHDIKDIGFNKSKISDCISGKMPQYYVLNKDDNFKCEYNEDGFDFHIVNFNMIEKAPISALKEFAKNSSNRLRLLPPYREHLSQAFAKYFMRIGLPSDINKNEVYKSMGL